MPRRLQALALRATLLAISTRATRALVVGRQSEQIHLGEGLAFSSEEIDETVDCDHIGNVSAQSYILLGAMDSGTNLLHQMMYTAWPSEVCMENVGIVWKHALTGANDLYHYMLKSKDPDSLRKTVVLHAVRSPISQLASWYYQGYEIDGCVTRPVSRWVFPCFARMGPHHPAGGTKLRAYNSTMDLYHQYLRQLEELGEAGWFKAVIPVLYEDMLLSPSETLADIAKHFEGLDKVQKAATEAAMQQPAKEGAKTLDDELTKLANKAYLQHFSNDDMKIICSGLNRTMLEHYHAGKFLKPSQRVSYWEDCAHP